MASHSQLKYGARFSFLGNNSTISCCEVLNSLIFPGHEQHHNNSFLCAALVMGQSNIAAGATIGSNHNSRAADGEMVSQRGFWPGLCVSLKHNSKFASFTLIAKGDYPYELNIRLPFSLINNDVANNRLTIMPAYWFMYNLYALARNSDKYIDRDKRTRKIQHIEYEYLAPDSVNEIFTGIDLLKKFTALASKKDRQMSESELLEYGASLLHDDAVQINELNIVADGFECSSRPVTILKAREAYDVYTRLIIYYGMLQLVRLIEANKIGTFDTFIKALPKKTSRKEWTNVGGQLLSQDALKKLIDGIKSNSIQGWDAVHEYYQQQGKIYQQEKLDHAYNSLLEILSADKLTADMFSKNLITLLDIKEWMVKNIHDSRAKDYQNEFRKMIYDSEEEMNSVVGKLEKNAFIAQQKQELVALKKSVENIRKGFGL
jgi:hypothetical protein